MRGPNPGCVELSHVSAIRPTNLGVVNGNTCWRECAQHWRIRFCNTLSLHSCGCGCDLLYQPLQRTCFCYSSTVAHGETPAQEAQAPFSYAFNHRHMPLHSSGWPVSLLRRRRLQAFLPHIPALFMDYGRQNTANFYRCMSSGTVHW